MMNHDELDREISLDEQGAPLSTTSDRLLEHLKELRRFYDMYTEEFKQHDAASAIYAMKELQEQAKGLEDDIRRDHFKGKTAGDKIQ